VSGEGTERLGDLVIKYLRDNIVDLCELIKSVIGDIEQAIVTANGDVLSKVVVAKILGGIEEGLRMLEDAALCDEYRDVATNAMLDAVGILLRVLYPLHNVLDVNKAREVRSNALVPLTAPLLQHLSVVRVDYPELLDLY